MVANPEIIDTIFETRKQRHLKVLNAVQSTDELDSIIQIYSDTPDAHPNLAGIEAYSHLLALEETEHSSGE